MRNYLLLHGAWHGGWCWRHVADRLRAQRHSVHAPTLTGLGERAHLLTPEVGLETFATDVIAVIEAEELEDVILVGHSFAGVVISLVADHVPERLRHLVYLDAVVLEPGQSPLDAVPPALAAERRRIAQETSGGLTLPAPAPTLFGVSEPDQVAWLQRRLTPHPFKAYTDPMTLTSPLGNGLPRTYIAATAPEYAPLASTRARVRSQAGWHWAEIATGHDAMVSAPDILADMLLAIG
jgi:pimeloyl-ACP methyl ester carboxylesterase